MSMITLFTSVTGVDIVGPEGMVTTTNFDPPVTLGEAGTEDVPLSFSRVGGNTEEVDAGREVVGVPPINTTFCEGVEG